MILDTNNILHIFIWFQILLFNTNNLYRSLWVVREALIDTKQLKIQVSIFNIVICIQLFACGLGDLGSILRRVIPKTLKWYLIPLCLTLSNIRYVSRVKRSNHGKGVAPSPTPWCSSYWKGSLLVTLDWGRQLFFYMIWTILIQITSMQLYAFE